MLYLHNIAPATPSLPGVMSGIVSCAHFSVCVHTVAHLWCMAISVWNVHTTLYWWLSDGWSLMKCNSTCVRWWAIVINAYRMHLQTNHTHRGCRCTVGQLITYQRSGTTIAQNIHLLIETLYIILFTHTLVLHLPLPAHSRMAGACLN